MAAESEPEEIELGVPYMRWPVRNKGRADYDFGYKDGRLSSELGERIMRWATWFLRDFDEVTNWRTLKTEKAHFAEGQILRDLLAEELGSQYHVVLTSMYPRIRPDPPTEMPEPPDWMRPYLP